MCYEAAKLYVGCIKMDCGITVALEILGLLKLNWWHAESQKSHNR
jgi:hypothetical protein